MEPNEKKTGESQKTNEQQENKQETSDVKLLLQSSKDINDVKGTNINFADASIKEEKNIVELTDINSKNKSKDAE